MILLSLGMVLAQILNQVSPGDRFAWVMQGPGLALIQSYRYEVEVDGQRLTDALKDVTCVSDGPSYECTAPIPISLGPHTLRVRWVDATVFGVPALEGDWSPPFLYIMRPSPPPPTSLRPVPPAPAQLRPVKPKP